MGVKDEIEKVSGKFNSKRVRMLIYGDSGTGKTVLASSADPEILFLDADDGLASVRNPVSRYRINSFGDLMDITDFLLSEDHGYKTIVVDSLNEIQRISMDYVIENYPAVKRSYKSLPSVSDYGKMLRDVDQWVRLMKTLDCHVIFIAQVQNRQFDTDLVQPQLTGKNTAQNICRMMDIVGHLFVSEGDDGDLARFIAFGVPDYVGKDRSDSLPSVYQIKDRNKGFQELKLFWK